MAGGFDSVLQPHDIGSKDPGINDPWVWEHVIPPATIAFVIAGTILPSTLRLMAIPSVLERLSKPNDPGNNPDPGKGNGHHRDGRTGPDGGRGPNNGGEGPNRGGGQGGNQQFAPKTSDGSACDITSNKKLKTKKGDESGRKAPTNRISGIPKGAPSYPVRPGGKKPTRKRRHTRRPMGRKLKVGGLKKQGVKGAAANTAANAIASRAAMACPPPVGIVAGGVRAGITTFSAMSKASGITPTTLMGGK